MRIKTDHVLRQDKLTPELDFRPIPSTGNRYEVNATGTVIRRVGSNYARKFQVDMRGTPYGYLYIRWSPSLQPGEKKKRSKDLYVHRAVAEAFIGPLGDLTVDHINANPHDNRVENLQLVTAEENLKLRAMRKSMQLERPPSDDLYKPRHNPKRIDWDRARDAAGPKSLLWNCAGCMGRPSYWGSDEETIWQTCQRCGHDFILSRELLLEDTSKLSNDRCPKCLKRDAKHPEQCVWKVSRCAQCSRWPFSRRPPEEKRYDAPETHRDWRYRREHVFERDGYRCQYCGEPVCAPHADHVVPRVAGGTDEPDNLVTACPRCNDSKGARPLEEWSGRKRRKVS